MMQYLMKVRAGKRKYKAKIMIYPTRLVGFQARLPDDLLAALRKQLERIAVVKYLRPRR